MNALRSRPLIVFLALSTLSMSAAAGNLGPTSRGTISISITVPPHVRVRPAGEIMAGADAFANGLCVGSNGLRQFHVSLIDNRGSASSIATPSQSRMVREAAGKGAFCAAGATVGGPAIEETFVAPTAPSSGKPLTLLIVPD